MLGLLHLKKPIRPGNGSQAPSPEARHASRLSQRCTPEHKSPAVAESQSQDAW